MTTPPSLAGQRVLLIAPAFFGYEQDIQRELERRGASVDRLLDRPFTRASMKALARFRREWIMPAADRYYRCELARLKPGYDVVLIVSGQTVSTTTMELITRENPYAHKILYMWDSLKNRPHVTEKFHFFDRILTFDHNDARQYGFDFRPTFYGPGFELCRNDTPSLAYSFVGTAHTDRYAVVSGITRHAPASAQSRVYYFLHAPWVYFAQKLINPAFRKARFSDFSFTPLSKESVREILRESNVIIDVEHPRQHGITMRCLDAFGAGKKLVTTNAGILEYNLFHPDNIRVVDRRDPVVEREFFERPATPNLSDQYYRFSISGWMDDILRRTPTMEDN